MTVSEWPTILELNDFVLHYGVRSDLSIDRPHGPNGRFSATRGPGQTRRGVSIDETLLIIREPGLSCRCLKKCDSMR
jgi:hypothetical protein